MAREHSDFYLFYIRYKTLEITTSQNPFQVIFNPGKGINTETYYRTIHPQNITLSIRDVFLTYLQKLIEYNENQDTPLYCPSHLKDLKHKSEYFEVPDLETKIQRHDNPHYRLQQDLLQVKNFQYRFVNNITLTEDTIPQVNVFTQFLLKFFRFNYQLLWEQQDQQAYINFPQILIQDELFPNIIKNEHEHLQYRDQNQESHELNPLYPHFPQASEIQQLNLETATIQNASELSEETLQTVQNTQSLTITNDSKLLQVPTHKITQNETNNQNQDTTLSATQDNTSVLSTSHTIITQPSQTQPSPRQNYDPLSISPQFSTQIHNHNSPEQGSSNTQHNTQHNNTVHFQTRTPP